MTDDNGVTAVEVDGEDWGRDRRKAIEAVDLAPESLVGSWFVRLEAEQPSWQGLVIGEPQAGVYLLELEGSDPTLPNVQRVMGLHQMLDVDEGYSWQFFDEQQEMHEWVSRLRMGLSS